MNPPQLFGVEPRPMYVYCLSYAWVELESYVETKCFVSFPIDSFNKAYESKEGQL